MDLQWQIKPTDGSKSSDTKKRFPNIKKKMRDYNSNQTDFETKHISEAIVLVFYNYKYGSEPKMQYNTGWNYSLTSTRSGHLPGYH
jgi:hypothetical protein